ncbi:MAG: hypothetical protein QNJ38_14450 [Prochloraceae cyanobacterium]|nr:hypothetical protein [Prochloraceae cyanobacterium]
MPQTKIQGKFYPLTSEITTKLRKGKLTAAEWRIWSYLVEIDPWGDRYQDIDSLDVMSKCDCSRATFYRAIAKFQKLQIFDIQDKGFSIRNLTGASQIKSAQAKEQNIKLKQADLKNEQAVSKIILDSQKCESCLKNETGFSKMRLDSQICENQPPETPPDKNFKSPQTLQTYADFKQTLSEGERENFFNFVRKKTENLEKPINDLEAWLASKNAAKQNRWEIYYKLFQESKNKEKSRQSRPHGSRNRTYTLEQKRAAIARFQAERNRNRPDLNDNPREKPKNNSEEYRQQQAEFNQLLDNPPEQQEKSLAQQRREAIAKAKEQHEAIKRANEKAAEELTRQQNPDLEQRRLEMLRQIEELNQRQKNQNPENNDEINEEDW